MFEAEGFAADQGEGVFVEAVAGGGRCLNAVEELVEGGAGERRGVG